MKAVFQPLRRPPAVGLCATVLSAVSIIPDLLWSDSRNRDQFTVPTFRLITHAPEMHRGRRHHGIQPIRSDRQSRTGHRRQQRHRAGHGLSVGAGRRGHRDLGHQRRQERSRGRHVGYRPARKILALECDVGDEAAVEAAFARTLDTFGRVDGCFANAGVSGRGGQPSSK